MDINGLSSYLKKFQVLLGDKKEEKKIIQEVIENTCYFSVSFDCISIRKGIIYIDTSPLQKTELIMNKKSLLKQYKDRGVDIIDLR